MDSWQLGPENFQGLRRDLGLSWESEGRIPGPCSGDSGEDIAKDIAKQDRENEDYDYTLGGKV